jgi:hypothetical protein
MNKLWILRPSEGRKPDDDPWNPWYDKAFGFVVSAPDEATARTLANSEAGDENYGTFMGREVSRTKTPWLDPHYSTCVELVPPEAPGIIMRDFASA